MTDDHDALAGPGLPVPRGFVRDELDRGWTVPRPREAVWGWLTDPATFTDAQVPPWRVEFLDPVTGDPSGFAPGVLTTHHGPLLHFAGVLRTHDEGRYRDLHYVYGAYALSLRLFRPVRLEFWLDDAPGDATDLRVRVTADVRAPLLGLWRWGNGLYWGGFGRWLARAVG